MTQKMPASEESHPVTAPVRLGPPQLDFAKIVGEHLAKLWLAETATTSAPDSTRNRECSHRGGASNSNES